MLGIGTFDSPESYELRHSVRIVSHLLFQPAELGDVLIRLDLQKMRSLVVKTPQDSIQELPFDVVPMGENLSRCGLEGRRETTSGWSGATGRRRDAFKQPGKERLGRLVGPEDLVGRSMSVKQGLCGLEPNVKVRGSGDGVHN
jgi:hypothetical protein